MTELDVPLTWHCCRTHHCRSLRFACRHLWAETLHCTERFWIGYCVCRREDYLQVQDYSIHVRLLTITGLFPHIFPIYLICAAPLLYFVGGGSQVCNALLFANVTGLTTDAARWVKATALIVSNVGRRS